MRLESRGAVFACALLAFVLTLGLGGAGGAWLVLREQARLEQLARRDAAEQAGAVARMLARPFERAARQGTPLAAVPGADADLRRTLAVVAAVSAITVRDAGGQVLHQARKDAPGDGATVTVPIAANGGEPAGRIDVVTAPAALARSLEGVWVATLLAVLACAAGAAGAAALAVGRPLQRRTERLAGWLAAAARGEAVALPHLPPADDALARAEQAFAEGQARWQEGQAAFDGYAEELLAVDFDGDLRPRIQGIARDVRALAEA
jgi:hypothetical protein